MNWDSPTARLNLIESIGIEAYNLRLREHQDARPAIYTVSTRFGVLHAVKGTNAAFSTRAQAEAFLKSKGEGK